MAIPVFIQILIGLIFSPTILQGFGINLGSAATTPATGTANEVVKAGTAESKPEVSPTAGAILNEAVKRPANWFGLALVVGGSVFLLAQTRAAAHEAGGALGDAYQESKNIGTSLRDADGSTGNISRRAKTRRQT